MPAESGKVLLTDRAWPDDTIEREIIEGAGFDLVAGPADPAPPAESVAELRTKAAQEVVRVLRGEPPHFPCNVPAGIAPAPKADR